MKYLLVGQMEVEDKINFMIQEAMQVWSDWLNGPRQLEKGFSKVIVLLSIRDNHLLTGCGFPT